MRYLLLAATAVVTLTACGGGGGQAATPTQSAEDAYLAELGEDVPAYEVEPDRDGWIERGWDACQAIKVDHLDDETIAQSWANLQGVDVKYAAAGVKAARAHLCDA